MYRNRRNRRRVDQGELRAEAKLVAIRVVKAVGLISSLVGICAATAFGTAKAREYIHTSPAFAIEKFKFENLKHANEDELIRLSGISIGDNVFQVDLPAGVKAIAAHPWVRTVSLERSYPKTIVVRVVEHEPAALADLGGLYYVNDAGKPFKKLASGEEGDMPILRGVSREEYVAREEEIENTFRDSLEAIALYREAGLDRVAPISEVKIDKTDGLTFFCGNDAVAVKLGFEGYREKFARLDRLFSELSRRHAKADVIRLDNRARPGWVAVQLAEGTVEETQ